MNTILGFLLIASAVWMLTQYLDAKGKSSVVVYPLFVLSMILFGLMFSGSEFRGTAGLFGVLALLAYMVLLAFLVRRIAK